MTATGMATAMARNVTSSVTGMPARKNGRKSQRDLGVMRFGRVGQHRGSHARVTLKRARFLRRGCQKLVVDVEAVARHHLRELAGGFQCPQLMLKGGMQIGVLLAKGASGEGYGVVLDRVNHVHLLLEAASAERIGDARV